ncbi:hypothetical protein FGRMN_5904 [Fusarium graminum]|nr:hypothetical protein FGRMN_5904 [Fusarium graminum]
MRSSMTSLPPTDMSIQSETDDGDSSETGSEASSRPDNPSAIDVNADTVSRASTELSEAPTVELLELSRPTSPEPHLKAGLGLHRSWGSTEYNDYDDIPIRQLDYSYATDESAPIFQKDGIKAVAQDLLRLYSEKRRELVPDETNRPIVWVCHDVGGTIVKQVLIEAAQAILSEDYEDQDTWELMKEAHRKVSIFSTGIVFLGCPHRAESIEVLEDELHNLLGLPGPDIRKGVMTKIRDLARQVNDTNIRALDGNLFTRITNINVFYLAPIPKDGEPGYDTPRFTRHFITTAPMRELPIVPALPFSQYTLTTSHWMEAWNRFPQSTVDHADLVRGDEGVEENSWIYEVPKRLIEAIYPLKVNVDIINQQAALLSMAPPRKYANVHLPLPGFLPSSTTPAFLTRDHLRAKIIPIGPNFTYICGLGDSARTSMLSQYWQVFDARRRGGDYDASVFHYEFDKLDSRRNTIRFMLLAYLNEMLWYSGSQGANISCALLVFKTLQHYQSWSLSSLFKHFQNLRCSLERRYMPIFLACFDDCVEDERTWFVKEVLDAQNRSDMPFRLIITASDPDTSLLDSAPEVQILTKKDLTKELAYPRANGEWTSGVEFVEEPMGLNIDEERIHATGFTSSLEALLLQRPALRYLSQPLQDLLTGFNSEPHFGFIVLNWLGGSGRRMSIATISKMIQRLRLATAEGIFNAIIENLPLERRGWAALVYRWVRYAIEPLTIEALGYALIVSGDSEDLNLTDVDQEQLVTDLETTFAGIIVIDGRDIKFSHTAFRSVSLTNMGEFHYEQPEVVHSKLAKACLEYLMHSQVQAQYRSLTVDNHCTHTMMRPLFLSRMDLLDYAVQYWVEHYRLAGNQCPFERAIEFFSNIEVRRKWAEAYYLLSNPFTRSQKSYLSPLPLKAALGLDDLVRHELGNKQSSQALRADIWLGVAEAARGGHLAVVSTLLDCLCASGDSLKDERYLLDALSEAASPDNENVLDVLISKANSISNFRWPESLYTRAVVAGSTTLVSTLIRAGLDVDWTDGGISEPALSEAISWNQPSIAKLLLGAGADYNLRCDGGRTRLLSAIRMCRPEIVQHLINAGANVEDRDENGLSAVNTAIDRYEKVSLRILIDAGANISFGENKSLPIVRAASICSPACLRVLLENGADPLIETERGSILYYVCGFPNHFDICRMLLKKGADPNKKYPDKNMMLIRVLKQRDRKLLELFLDEGGIPDSFDEWEGTTCRTPLTHAAGFLPYDFFKLLLDRGASPNYCPNGTESPLYMVAWLGGHNTRKAELLLERGADLNWRQHDGRTPLQAAYDSPELVTLFLRHGADVETQTSAGTVLMLASKWGCIDTLKTLVAHRNPQPNLDTGYEYEGGSHRGYTALTFAIAYGNFDCANFLIESGASIILDPGSELSSQTMDTSLLLETDIDDKQAREMAKFIKTCLDRGLKPDATDDSRNTFLHGVGSTTTVAAIQVLIESGVPFDSKDAAGLTPLAIVAMLGNVNAVKYLLSKHARATIFRLNPVFLACTNSDIASEDVISILKSLIEAKACPHTIGSSQFPTLLGLAVFFHEQGGRKLARYLVDTVGVRVNAPEGSQIHPINVAAKHQDTRLFEYLLRRGADISLADNMGRRVVHHAAQLEPGILTKWRLLKRSNVDFLSTDNYGRTPIHLAAAFGYLSDVGWFARHVPNIDWNLPDGDGWTPLMWACKLDHTNATMVRWLTKHDADIWHKSNDGEWSALKIAHLTDMDLETFDLLQPPESERERIGPDGAKETWDPLHEFEDHPGLDTAGSVKNEQPAVENDGTGVSSGSHKTEGINTEDAKSDDDESEETEDDDSEE